jgi:hypothetical protein
VGSPHTRYSVKSLAIIGDRPRLILRAVGYGKGRKEERDNASKITQKFNRGLSPIILISYKGIIGRRE